MPEALWNIACDFWAVLGEMAPYLLFGFLVAGVLSVAVSPAAVERHLGGRGIWPVVKAAVFGIPLPLCSCGVIPVGASLRRHGASRGATTAFLIATPQDGADSIFVTLSLLGGTFAVFRTLAALVSGVIGGAVASVLGGGDGPDGRDAPPPVCREACCAPSAGGGGKVRRALTYGFATLPEDLGKALLVGLAAAALISALVPADALAGLLGGGVAAMMLMMMLGIPVYVCATASVPVAAALIAKGVSPGAALVFLMTGPATNAAAIATVWKVMGRRTAIVYLATVAATALAAGLTLDWLFAARGVAAGAGEKPWMMLPGPVKWGSAVVLLAVLAVGIVRSALRGRAHDHAGEADAPPGAGPAEGITATFRVSGMTCSHCRQAVQRALTECEGAESVTVDLAGGTATVTGPAEPGELRRAVEALGYRVEPVVS